MIVEECRRMGVRYLTLFAFSSENWERPHEEVSGLMKLFHRYLESELELMLKNGVRLRAIGDRSKLPKAVVELLERNEEATKNLEGMDLILALSYGGRQEIVQAAKRLVEDVTAGRLAADQISENDLRMRLYAPDIPDPDLLIRSSGEFRISNFLLWQLAYTEIVVVPELWPDFTKESLLRCLSEFAGRERRFGRSSVAPAGGDSHNIQSANDLLDAANDSGAS
jgi:undecaprenyl diphosphate synthase